MFAVRNLLFKSILVTGLLLVTTPVLALHSHTQLPDSVVNQMKRYKIPRDSLSLYIVDLDIDHPIIELNPDTPRNPASVIKLLTTYAGLDLLGPAYTWETRFYIDGDLDNGILDGNLVLQGGGDPFLTREDFWHMLYTLRARGIQHIRGDLIIDDSLFENETGSTGDFDKRPYAVYNTFPSAVLLNFNAQEFVVLPGKHSVHVYADPPADNLKIRNNIKTASGPCYQSGAGINLGISREGKDVIADFSGKHPRACGERILLRSVMPPIEYVYGVFKSMWQDMGGTISGTYRNTVMPLPDRPFYLNVSRPLREIITSINKFSNNVMARQLFLTIGQIKEGTPGKKESGNRVIQNWMQSIGIHAPELVLENGSGLSRTTRISARNMGKVLQHAWSSPLSAEFLSSLPIAGIDGTMRKRLNKDTPTGNIRIKTGLLRSVRSMAGYIKSKNGKHYLVVSLQNFPSIQNTTGTLIQDEILKWLYDQ